MKLAVSAQDSSLDSPFEPRFGRAPGFVVYDTESQSVTFIDNRANQNLPQGSGIQAAQVIADKGVQVLISGNIGPKASQALAHTSIQILRFNGATVREAVQAYLSGSLQPSGGQRPIPGGRTSSGGAMGRGMGGGRGIGRGRGRTMGGSRGAGRGGGRGMGSGSR